MYISSVLSHLGAWNKLQNDYPDEYYEIQQVITNTQIERTKKSRRARSGRTLLYSPSELVRGLKEEFTGLGWETRSKLYLGQEGTKRRYSMIGAIKNDVGIDYSFGKFVFTESVLYVKFPIFIQALKIRIGCLLVASEALQKSMSVGAGSFEMLRDRIMALAPLPLKYPFAIVGLSDQTTSSPSQVQELTSELDQFLLAILGYTMNEMALLSERANYDFKLSLPQNRTTAKEICALANHSNGGVILLGVDDAGLIKGIDRAELDETQLKIESIAKDSCRPRPTVSFHVFDVPDDPNRCVLVTQIDEVERKPCMTSDRVYIRAGASARPAGPDEIRRLIFRGEV